MAPFGQPRSVSVDLAPFWAAWEAIQQEHARLGDYTAASGFWTSYDAKLRGSSELLSQARKDMELNTQWTSPGNANAASTAFYGRMDAGADSIKIWLGSDTAGAQREFGTLVGQLEAHFRAMDGHRNWLLAQDKMVGATPVRFGSVPTLLKISDQDRGTVQVEEKTSTDITGMITDAVRLRDELTRQFEKVRMKLEALPHNQKWLGPTTLAAPTAPGPGPGPGGPGGAPTASGPNATGPNATGPNAPGADKPGAPTGPPSDAPAPAMSPPSPGGDKPGGPDLGPKLPATDPVLASAPSPTVTPLPGTDPRIPTGGPALTGLNPGPSVPLSPTFTPIGNRDSPSPFTPLGTSPGQTPARRVEPARSNPVGGGARAASPLATPGPGVGAAEGAPVLARAPAPGGSGSTATGSGFYPPMMPPMYPPSGGGGGGIKPGEAEFAGGSTLRGGGRDSWRAGLRPQLQGRAGDRDDDEQRDIAPAYPVPGGDVLDEELWQVPDAAPAAPPEPQSRRGRSRGF